MSIRASFRSRMHSVEEETSLAEATRVVTPEQAKKLVDFILAYKGKAGLDKYTKKDPEALAAQIVKWPTHSLDIKGATEAAYITVYPFGDSGDTGGRGFNPASWSFDDLQIAIDEMQACLDLAKKIRAFALKLK